MNGLSFLRSSVPAALAVLADGVAALSYGHAAVLLHEQLPDERAGFATRRVAFAGVDASSPATGLLLNESMTTAADAARASALVRG